MIELTGRTFIVTGGAQGIGRGIVETLLAAGASVVIADLDRDAGEELLEMLAVPERLKLVQTDVKSEVQVARCLTTTIERFGGLDGLVNNAGIASPGRIPVTELTLAQWELMITTNLTSSFLTAKHAAPHLCQRGGAIVNISSTRALQSEANTEAYSAAKGGLVALTHALAISLGNRIRVNAILPGWIDIGPYRKKALRREPVTAPEEHQQHPAGRIGIPADIGALTAFLLSDAAGFITGQAFVVDGGMTKKMIYRD
ncbi:MAG: SDR family oxidoreductase [Desulfofustis sp.]|nr:SDR family oxidoreductase [Desulfofustis sp.]